MIQVLEISAIAYKSSDPRTGPCKKDEPVKLDLLTGIDGQNLVGVNSYKNTPGQSLNNLDLKGLST